MSTPDVKSLAAKAAAGGEEKYHSKNTEVGKLFARERIRLFCDPNTFVEDALFANCAAEGLPADGVIIGLGRVDGRTVAIMANDSTVKAGSWGARTVEKIVRIQEVAMKLEVPLCYLVDSAGARITDQVEMFPGRRGAGKIFYNQSNVSGKLPQICLLFGPSAAGGAYIPAFCDINVMVEGNASMYLGSPRMAESVIGEKVTLEEMGGARMHCTVSGVGDFLMKTESEAIALARRYLSYFPSNYQLKPPSAKSVKAEKSTSELKAMIPETAARAYDMKQVLKTVIDAKSFLEIKELYAKEVITGLARVEGEVVGIVANQPLVKGGVLFSESANKAARFIQLCDAFQIPILFFADVPGFMIGSQVERGGIIRAGAKMIYALSNAKVPKLCLIVRKAFGAGLYAMCGPAFDPEAVIALPSAQIAVMGPEPAVNAVYFNKIAALPEAERKQFVADKIEEYLKDVDLMRLASELVVDQVVDYADFQTEVVNRLKYVRERAIARRDSPGIMPM